MADTWEPQSNHSNSSNEGISEDTGAFGMQTSQSTVSCSPMCASLTGTSGDSEMCCSVDQNR